MTSERKIHYFGSGIPRRERLQTACGREARYVVAFSHDWKAVNCELCHLRRSEKTAVWSEIEHMFPIGAQP